MTVKRIVPNFSFSDMPKAKDFYREIFDLDIAMDLGWIVTFSSDALAQPQISVATQGGAGTEVPSVSIEVDNVDDAFQRAQNYGAEIVYQITNEDWGVRRFFVRDPAGMVLNVLSHL